MKLSTTTLTYDMIKIIYHMTYDKKKLLHNGLGWKGTLRSLGMQTFQHIKVL